MTSVLCPSTASQNHFYSILKSWKIKVAYGKGHVNTKKNI
jgi:hypothetical protein